MMKRIKKHGVGYISIAILILFLYAMLDRYIEIKILQLSLFDNDQESNLLFGVVQIMLSIFITYLCYYFIRIYFDRALFELNARYFIKGFFVSIVAVIKVCLWGLLLIVPGIMKLVEYSIVPLVYMDNPTDSIKEVHRKSREIMYGKRLHLFLFQLVLGTIFAAVYIPISYELQSSIQIVNFKEVLAFFTYQNILLIILYTLLFITLCMGTAYFCYKDHVVKEEIEKPKDPK